MTTAKLTSKRRKLSSPKLSVAVLSSSIASPVSSASNKPVALACVSCHRRAQSASRSLIVFCARCGSATCTICSRTCTASAVNRPPNPHLTWSTTSPSPISLDSPTHSQTQSNSTRRFALTLNSANTNSVGCSSTGKRKKVKDDDDDDVERDGAMRLEETELGYGCGRTVCKNCCFESNRK